MENFELVLEFYNGYAYDDGTLTKTTFSFSDGKVIVRERTTHSWHEGFDCDFDKIAETMLCLNEANTEKLFSVLGGVDLEQLKSIIESMFKVEHPKTEKFYDGRFFEMDLTERIDEVEYCYNQYCNAVNRDDTLRYIVHQTKFQETKFNVSGNFFESKEIGGTYKKASKNRARDKFIVFCQENEIRFDLSYDYEKWPF